MRRRSGVGGLAVGRGLRRLKLDGLEVDLGRIDGTGVKDSS